MVTLEDLKRQCRVDYNDDDQLLQNCLDSAIEETVRLTGRDLGELIRLGHGVGLPTPLRQAVLIRAAEYYAHPEGTEKPNHTYFQLIRSYQKI